MGSDEDGKPESATPGEMTEDEIDEAIEDSFPASDPPPWTLGVEPHPPDDDDDDETK